MKAAASKPEHRGTTGQGEEGKETMAVAYMMHCWTSASNMLDELTGWTGGGLDGWKDGVNERLGG